MSEEEDLGHGQFRGRARRPVRRSFSENEDRSEGWTGFADGETAGLGPI